MGGGGGRAVLFAHGVEDHAVEMLIVEKVVLRGFDSSCAKFAEFVHQLDGLGSEGGQNGVFIGLVVGEAISYFGRQGFPKIVGQRKTPEVGVFGENGDLRKVFPEEVVDAAETRLAAHLEDSAEAAETVGDLTDGFGIGGGSGAHVVEAQDTDKEVKLTAVEKMRDAGGDGGRTGTVGRAAVVFEWDRIQEGCIKGSLIGEE
jgi:hypothetical protein